MMDMKHLLCTIALTFSLAIPVYGATDIPQTIKALSEDSSGGVIELTGSKVITEDFSFKVPQDWTGSCVMIQEGEDLEVYNKAAYEEDGSGLMFTIAVYEDTSYKDLEGCTILGFCGNKTYILEDYYSESEEDHDSPEYKLYIKAVKSLKKSFVSLIKEEVE